MRLPRDLSAKKIIKGLKFFGYEITRQTGSHIRLTTSQKSEHHVTIPNHDSLRIGTLSNIVSDVSQHFEISKEDVIKRIF